MALESDCVPVWPELVGVIAESPVRLLPDRVYVVELPRHSPPPTGTFAFLRDDVEVTAVVSEAGLAAVTPLRRRGPFRVLRFVLSKPFEAPGFLASASMAVALQRVNQLIYSTYSFDYLLVADDELTEALTGLRRMGFPIEEAVEGPQP